MEDRKWRNTKIFRNKGSEVSVAIWNAFINRCFGKRPGRIPPDALKVSDIDSEIGLMHTLFALEACYGLEVCESEGEMYLRVNPVKGGSDGIELQRMLDAWNNEITKLKTRKSPGKNMTAGAIITRNTTLPGNSKRLDPPRNSVIIWLQNSKIKSDRST